MPERFSCGLRFGHRAAWIYPRGELDLDTAPQLEQRLGEALDSTRLVVIDLRGLEFMDSSGVHLIIEADARARREDRELVFVRGPDQVERLFDLVGLSTRLRIIDATSGVASSCAPRGDAPMEAA